MLGISWVYLDDHLTFLYLSLCCGRYTCTLLDGEGSECGVMVRRSDWAAHRLTCTHRPVYCRHKVTGEGRGGRQRRGEEGEARTAGPDALYTLCVSTIGRLCIGFSRSDLCVNDWVYAQMRAMVRVGMQGCPESRPRKDAHLLSGHEEECDYRPVTCACGQVRGAGRERTKRRTMPIGYVVCR
jgi:hypothetical protein